MGWRREMETEIEEEGRRRGGGRERREEEGGREINKHRNQF